MPRVSRAISALGAIAIPPPRSPNFLNPLNWGGHLIGTGMWQLCQPCSNVNNQRHLHTLSSTPQLFWRERHLAHHLLPPVFLCKSWWVYPHVRSCTGWRAEYQFAWFSSFTFQLFVVLGHLPSFSSKPPLLLLPFVIDQQLFPASPPWKRTRTACQMLGKNSVGVNWKQIHPEYVPWWGDNKSWWWHIWGGKKAKLCYASSMLWSILGRAKLVFFDILEVFAWITITLKGIIWNQCSATRSPC